MNRRTLVKTMMASVAARPGVAQSRPSNFAPEPPPEVDAGDPLVEAGCIDVTKAPYFADSSGEKDATAAIQRAVNEARDYQYVCFFPSGTYLISDTISCEQPVRKLDEPRFTDSARQSYWNIPNRTVVLIGDTRGKRPVLKLAADAKGFDNPERPKYAVYIWAQTRTDAPGKEEPEWGKEQPNISFGHTFRGIDIDVRGHAGAVGIRHTGSQGATLQDCTIHAEGAFAGMSNCPGQGGGTYNIEVRGGRYGIVSDPACRFPMLCACVFKGQTEAAVAHSTVSPPLVLAGCLIETAGGVAIDLTGNRGLTGVSAVDCVIDLKREGLVFAVGGHENLLLEDCFVRGATAVHGGGGKISRPGEWTRISRYSWSVGNSVTCINGEVTTDPEVAEWSAGGPAPSYPEIHTRHWSRVPSFLDSDAVSVKSLGAKGDGETDDTEAFRRAIARHQKVFVPRGAYRVSGPLALGRKTALLGLHQSFSRLEFGDAGAAGSGAEAEKPVVTMPNETGATTSVTFLSCRGLVEWTAGRGLLLMSPARLRVSGSGGGRFCGVTAIFRGFRVDGTRERIAFYSLNVERVETNPQSEIRGARNVKIYFLKVEASPTGHGKGVAERTGNTPLAIVDSRNIQVYCVNGNVVTAEQRPMIDVVNSDEILVFHAKSFKTGDFSQIREVRGDAVFEVPSDRASALLVRE